MAVYQLPKHLHPDFADPSRKPAGQDMEIDRDHWLGKTAVCAIVPQFSMRDLIQGSLTVNSAGASVSDRLFKTVGNANDYAEYSQPLPKLTECTLIFRGRMGTGGGGVFGDKALANWSTNGVSCLRWNHARAVFWKINNSETIPHESGGYFNSSTEIYDAAFTWKAGEFQNIYENGVEPSYSSHNVASSHTVSAESLKIGSGYTEAVEWSLDAEYEYMYFFAHGMTTAEVRAFHKAPYQVLKPKTPQTYFVTGAGGGPTITPIPPKLHNSDRQFSTITAHRLGGVLS